MKKILSVLVGIAVLGLVGCGQGIGTKKGDITSLINVKDLEVKPYESCEQMEQEIAHSFIAGLEKGYGHPFQDGRVAMPNYDASPGAPTSASPNMSMSESAPSYTDTNVQEIGVDEADLIKTDGEYLYSIIGQNVKITRVWPFAEFGLVSEIEMDKTPSSLYLKDDLLVIIAVQYNYYDDVREGADAGGDIVEVTVFNVSNPVVPEMVSEKEYAGELFSSRRIDEKIYLIMNTILDVELLKKDTEQDNCKTIYRTSEKFLGWNFLSVITLDLTHDFAFAKATKIIGSGGTVYASLDNIYIAFNGGGAVVVSEDQTTEATIIHRFNLGEKEHRYAGSASVEGHLVDNSYVGSHHSSRFSMAQFAMSEFDGFLRVATTKGHVIRSGNSTSQSQVSVIDVSKDEMPVVSSVTDLGLGERIYAVRFIGERGYVVTFKKVDPLYVIDLSNPLEPEAAGELKIPGFSTYLHPLDEEHVIGLGFDAYDEGSFAWTQGIKLALFDVSDPSNPVEVSHRVIGTRGTYSPAVEEHHAFTLDSKRGLLALPIDLYENSGCPSCYGQFQFSGVMLLNVDLMGNFETMGELRLFKEMQSYGGYYNASAQVLRNVIIGDGEDEGLVTLTTDSIHLNRIDDQMSEIGVVE